MPLLACWCQHDKSGTSGGHTCFVTVERSACIQFAICSHMPEVPQRIPSHALCGMLVDRVDSLQSVKHHTHGLPRFSSPPPSFGSLPKGSNRFLLSSSMIPSSSSGGPCTPPSCASPLRGHAVQGPGSLSAQPDIGTVTGCWPYAYRTRSSARALKQWLGQ